MTVYIPFGKNCAPAFILRYANLRKESLPFDWGFAYPEHIKRSLDTRFEDWFSNIERFEYPKVGIDGIAEATSNKYGTINKNYPVSLDIQAMGSFMPHMDFTDPEIVQTMKKRIARFYEILDYYEEIVFFSCSSYEDLKSHGLLDYFNRDAKTSFLLLDYNISTSRSLSVDEVEGYTVIKANGIHIMDHDMFKTIANTVKSLG